MTFVLLLFRDCRQSHVCIAYLSRCVIETSNLYIGEEQLCNTLIAGIKFVDIFLKSYCFVWLNDIIEPYLYVFLYLICLTQLKDFVCGKIMQAKLACSRIVVNDLLECMTYMRKYQAETMHKKACWNLVTCNTAQPWLVIFVPDSQKLAQDNNFQTRLLCVKWNCCPCKPLFIIVNCYWLF